MTLASACVDTGSWGLWGRVSEIGFALGVDGREQRVVLLDIANPKKGDDTCSR